MDASIAFKIIENLGTMLNEQLIALYIMLFSQIVLIISIIVFIKTQVKSVDYFGTEFVFDSQLDEKNPTVVGYAEKVSGREWSSPIRQPEYLN